MYSPNGDGSSTSTSSSFWSVGGTAYSPNGDASSGSSSSTSSSVSMGALRYSPNGFCADSSSSSYPSPFTRNSFITPGFIKRATSPMSVRPVTSVPLTRVTIMPRFTPSICARPPRTTDLKATPFPVAGSVANLAPILPFERSNKMVRSSSSSSGGSRYSPNGDVASAASSTVSSSCRSAGTCIYSPNGDASTTGPSKASSSSSPGGEAY